MVLGTLAGDPFAGMAWMHMQFVVGLRRLGHDVTYLELTSSWPYDPLVGSKVGRSDYAVEYLARVCAEFGVDDCWGYRDSYATGEWSGPQHLRADDLLAHADAVLNIAGATRLDDEGFGSERLVLIETDPILLGIGYAAGDSVTRRFVDGHHDVVTYGENIGTPVCPVAALPRQRATMRQPILLDRWKPAGGEGRRYTTVANWSQRGADVEFAGRLYHWSKDHEFRKVIGVPARVSAAIELATNLTAPDSMPLTDTSVHEPIKSRGVLDDDRALLATNGWGVVDSVQMSMDPMQYHDYIEASRGEFTVARDLHARLQSGWFSERSACYLAAGRPVVTQDTGFGVSIPTGTGLLSFTSADEAVDALTEVESDYDRHAKAARGVAEEYFGAESVLGHMLTDLNLS